MLPRLASPRLAEDERSLVSSLSRAMRSCIRHAEPPLKLTGSFEALRRYYIDSKPPIHHLGRDKRTQDFVTVVAY